MTQKLNSFEKFWKELKRRRVVHVITVYAAVSFVTLQLVDIVEQPLRLPDWTTALVIVLLCIGFVIAVFLSWIYDITPAGVKKTKPVNAVKHTDHTTTQISIGWKIATYISGVIIVASVALNFISRRTSNTDISRLDKSIAVLPFTNLSIDTEQEYFCEGIVEAILDNLFKIGELKVKFIASTRKYRDNELSSKEIAKELGVTSILLGSVQKIGNDVRITVRLIEAETNLQLWSETYNEDLSDIFSIQTKVAQNVASELKAKLTSEEKEKIKMSQTQNTEAFNLYLQGRFFWNKRTKEGLRKSIEYFEKAIALDQNYALAIAGLADAYNVQAFWGWSPAEQGYAEAKDLAEKAINMDYKLAEAHATLGNILCYGEWKWEEAKRELLYAIKLNPKYATAHQYYSELLDVIGQNEEARLQINLALELDPYNLLFHFISAQNYYHAGNLNKSLEECLEIQELDSTYSLAYLWSFNIYIRKGEDIKAVESLQKMISLDPLIAKHAYEVKGVYKKSQMNGLIDWLIELNLKMNAHFFYVADSAFYVAKWYAMLDKKDKALDWLEKSIENRSKIAQINNDPDFYNLRSEPRFQKLMGRMGLSEYGKKE